MRVLFLLPGLLALGPVAAAAASLHLVAGTEDSPLSDRPVNTRLGEPVTVCAVVKLGRRYYSDAPRRVRLGGRLLHRRRLRPTETLPGSSPRWRWYRVEPRPHHVETTPPNKDNPAYSNAVLFGPDHGKWLGYDRIEYKETLLSGHGQHLFRSCITVTRTSPTDPKVNVNGGLGTMRYKATLELGDRLLASPGMEKRSRRGISPRVMRVTFRSDDSFTGYMRGYFNVPNVFGSGGAGRTHQTALYQGADCADVITGGVREAGGKMAFTSVLGFRRYARAVTDKLLMTKTGIFAAAGPDRGKRVVLRFGHEVQPGDIMLIDYAGFEGSPRSWDHIAVIDRDRGATRGELDPQDPVLHMGYLYGLAEEPAATQAPAIIKLLRLKPHILRAMKNRARRRRSKGAKQRRGGAADFDSPVHRPPVRRAQVGGSARLARGARSGLGR
jgi:hypothetical protein